MSGEMEHFESSEKLSVSRPAGGSPLPCFPSWMQSRARGIEPTEAIVAPLLSPKAAAASLEQFVFARSRLMRADQRGPGPGK